VSGRKTNFKKIRIKTRDLFFEFFGRVKNELFPELPQLIKNNSL